MAAKRGMPRQPRHAAAAPAPGAGGRAAHADGARRRRLGDPQGADLRHDPGRPRAAPSGRSAARSVQRQPRRLAAGASRRGDHRPRSRRRLRRRGTGRRAGRGPGRRPLAPGRQPGRRAGGLLPRQGAVPRRPRPPRSIAQADGQRARTATAPPPADAVYQGKRRHPAAGALARAAGGGRRGRGGAPAGEVRAGAGAARQGGVPSPQIARDGRDLPDDRLQVPARGAAPAQAALRSTASARVLTPCEPYLLQRWAEGCHTATVLWREIQAQGFAYSVTNVQRFVAELRREGPPPAGRPRTALTKTARPAAPAGRRARPAAARTAHRRAARLPRPSSVPRIRPSPPRPTSPRTSSSMLRRREGERLPAWLDAAEASGIDDLARFARQAPDRPGGRAGRADAAVEQRADRGPRQPPEAGQAAGLRAGQGRPPAQAGARARPDRPAPEDAISRPYPSNHRSAGDPGAETTSDRANAKTRTATGGRQWSGVTGIAIDRVLVEKAGDAGMHAGLLVLAAIGGGLAHQRRLSR